MRDIKDCKDEIRRRGEARILQIAQTRRRVRAVCGSVSLCLCVALVLTVVLSSTRMPFPIISGDPTTTTAASTVATTAGSTTDTSVTTSATTSDGTHPSATTTTSRAPFGTTVVIPTTILTTVSSRTTTTTVKTLLPTTVPTTAPTTVSSSTSVTTVTEPTTTTTKGGMKPPLGEKVVFVNFAPASVSGTVGEQLTVPFSVSSGHHLIAASFDIIYDPTVLEPEAVNADENNPFVTALNEQLFAGGTVYSRRIDDHTVRVEIVTTNTVGVEDAGEMFRVNFRAVGETSRASVKILPLETVVDAQATAMYDFVWSYNDGFVTVAPPSEP